MEESVLNKTLLPETEAKPVSLHPEIKLWLSLDRSFFGPGTARLLELIDRTGSVRLACQQMELSYSKGWKLLIRLEEQTGKTLVDRHQGGKNGGAAILTPEGAWLLAKYRELEERGRKAVEREFDAVFGKEFV